MRHAHIHVTGIVQGVGMRPFVYREAMAHGICGWVLNAGDGVHIEAHALSESLDEFVDALSEHAPAASRVEHVEVVDLAPGNWDAANEQGFRIVASQDQTAHTTLVSPDIATCDDCLRELFDPADRRYHYPFINCTNCGPRFTIIRSLPYDRAATSMDCFPCAPSAPRSMPTHSTGVFTRSPMPALIAGRILRGARPAKPPRRRPSAPRARPVTPLSTAVLSCWPTAVSSLSRVWADFTWHATPPTSRR